METISVNIPAKYAFINSLDEFVVEAIEQKLAKTKRVPNAETLKTFAETQNIANLVGPFNSVEELMNDLNK
jgi:hypothetical protein